MDRRRFLQSATEYLGALGIGACAFPYRSAWASTVEPINSESASSQIFLNQLGYLPARSKVATVRVRAAAYIVRSMRDHSITYRGTLSAAMFDPASGDWVQKADFSALKISGEYRLELDSGVSSDPFSISDDSYQFALWQASRAFYGQRCGCSVNLGGGYEHSPCHLHSAYHASSGKTGHLKNHGGWHDAGDYGRYMVNCGIATGTLLWAWEMYGGALDHLALQIPESGGKLPDFLAEIQWNLNWMLTLQDTDGGVWQKQTSEEFCPFVMPQDDTAISYIIGTGVAPYKSTGATADFAAVMAIAARCYGAYAPTFAQQCITAARKAWTWCQKYPTITFHNPPGIGTGQYEDHDCQDEILWATAEMWRTTGEKAFYQAFVAMLPQSMNDIQIQAPSWASVSSMAYWSYALAGEKLPDATITAIELATMKAADALMKQSAENGYGNTLAMEDYIWGSNGVAANHSLLLLLANHFHPNPALVDCALNNLHYLLGRNCLGMSWITQLGTHPLLHPHHRPSVADHLASPWPGLLSGGPNANPADKVAQTLLSRPPMRMYIDNDQAYSCNEVAINWNAPLVFLLAAARSA